MPTVRVCGPSATAKNDERGNRMTIEVCGWRLEPNQSNGRRCWCLYHGKATRPERFYDDLGRALRFVVEYGRGDGCCLTGSDVRRVGGEQGEVSYVESFR